ncbi:tetratricopeptide repeat protein [Vibrio marisflavi]|uniref:Anaphase-promoting complex, cyclosome, subunit 3 n=1 Tax=Vibrio marisflavi CECT 7928 TaxID=634439 RepID=A0ABN8E3G3_9VIBR|nr:tetratricopeptide repeat protein [Vibrio marisflavi]CAH0539659.1 hypothetical protein VMF7928_02336 [Vibrio marisflavi CECT 7928]
MKNYLSLLLLLLFCSQAAYASGERLSQYTNNMVQQANHLVGEKEFAQAIQLLKKADLSREYDKVYVARMLGVIYWQNNQNKLAIQQLSTAVNSNVLHDEQAWTTKKMLADLLLMQHQYEQSLHYYYSLIDNMPKQESGADVWLRIAQANYQLSRWKQVLSAMKQYDEYKKAPTVSPISLKLGAQVQLQLWHKAAVTANRLIALEPENLIWWRQLVAIQLRENKTKAALNTMSLAKLQGLQLTQKDIQLLAQLYAQVGIPLRAAQTMEQIKDISSDINLLTQQAAYWQLAKEWPKAVKSWLLAAKKNNKYRWNAIQILTQQGEDKKAISELDKITAPKQQAKVALIKAQAYYRLGDIKLAVEQAKYSKKLKDTEEARSWVDYLATQQ